ncbi:MAG: C40 family peptidase [Saccharopolyspora sp.]|uniref:C40 family peptidase n=1 Tax=Saccharopolyspora TaxID=1835 RepID=UPI00190C57E6|nr:MULTISPECIES: C40 family peptidase [unclassified Saccharopolyspora]MBQ6643149.1 C40 family peptidase [Saccharopolyspora sp.]
MSSSRLKRSMGGALAATVVVTTVGVSTPAAIAQPPGNASDAQKQLKDLGRKAEELTEAYKGAQDEHAKRQDDLNRANAEAEQAGRVAEQARAEEERFRQQVDGLVSASYQGARMSKLSALLVSESPNDFLDRASALDALGKDNNKAVQTLSGATHRAEGAEQQAQDARNRATQAEADAARLEGEIAAKKGEADAQVAKVKQQYNSLSAQEQESMSGGSSNVGLLGGAGVAIQAANAALGKQGSPYVFGAKGPSQFDCSGLVQWSYQQAGVSLPSGTKAQMSAGKKVSKSEMKPGDVIFFYSSGSHNGIYIGGGKIVHAPTEGQDVTVEEVEYMGQVNSVRRFAG